MQNIPKTPSKRIKAVDRDTVARMKKWVDHIGVDFLNKSMERLEVSLQDIKSFNYKHFSFDFLLKEKKQVKELLKQYDVLFAKKFNSSPSKTEKEPLRPLYMYYKKLKQGIVLQQKSRKASMSTRQSQPQLITTNKPELTSTRRSYDISKSQPKTLNISNTLQPSNKSLKKHPSTDPLSLPNETQSNIPSSTSQSSTSPSRDKENINPNEKYRIEVKIKEMMNQREKCIQVGFG